MQKVALLCLIATGCTGVLEETRERLGPDEFAASDGGSILDATDVRDAGAERPDFDGGHAVDGSPPDSGPSPNAGLDAGSPPNEGPGVFVATGYSVRRIRSTDGIHWTHDVHSGVENTGKGLILRSVVASPDGFVAVGENRSYFSEDGTNWTMGSHDAGWFGGVTYGNGMYVGAGGNGSVARSFDGLTWERAPQISPRNHFRAIGFGAGVFLAAGDQGTSATSTDGLVWSNIVVEGAGHQAVGFGAGTFVVVGHGNRRVRSVDGATFTDNARADGGSLRDIVFARGRFWTLGAKQLFVSPDGKTWEEHAVAHHFSDLAYGNGHFVAVAGASIFTSDDALSWTSVASGGPKYWSVTFRPD